MIRVQARSEKMSKSRGNVVLPQEVAFGVYELDARFAFCLESGEEVLVGGGGNVWRDRGASEMFFTTSRLGRLPVFLIDVESCCPVLLLVNGVECRQHPGLDFWKEEV